MTRAVRLSAMAIIAAALTFLLSLPSNPLHAQSARNPQPTKATTAPQDHDGHLERTQVLINKSKVIQTNRPYERIIIGKDDIADAAPVTDRSFYVLGKKIGSTNVTLLDGAGKVVEILDIDVTLDARALERRIRSAIGENSLMVESADGMLVLTGSMQDLASAERAVAIARSVAGENAVINALQIRPSQQVLLEVRFLEVSRDAGRQLGIEWFGANRSGTVGGTIGRGAVVAPRPGDPSPPSTPNGIPLFQTAGSFVGNSGTPFGTFIANALTTNNARIDVVVTALEEQGLVRILAEPNLTALSGDTARFLAGGEFPVPVVSSGGSTSSSIVFPTPTIQYKEFGIKLNFTPTVLSRGIINLRVNPEVSELDYSRGVSISGTIVPGISKRDALTTIELRDGQSFAIAGLLSNVDTKRTADLPWIGTVPVIGALFQSSNYQKKETDLVIVVTPRLVAPSTPGQPLKSPLAKRLPANDIDFFLNRKMDVVAPPPSASSKGGGHLLPQPKAATP